MKEPSGKSSSSALLDKRFAMPEVDEASKAWNEGGSFTVGQAIVVVSPPTDAGQMSVMFLGGRISGITCIRPNKDSTRVAYLQPNGKGTHWDEELKTDDRMITRQAWDEDHDGVVERELLIERGQGGGTRTDTTCKIVAGAPVCESQSRPYSVDY